MVEVDATLVAVLVVALNLVADGLIVAWLAGWRSKRALVSYLRSEDSNELWDKAAERVMVKFEPRIMDLEAKIPQGEIQLDTSSLVAAVKAQLVPDVRAEVDKVRAVIDGKLGFARKALKATGEAVAEAAGLEAAEAAGLDESDPSAMLKARLASLRLDDEWVKEHPLAAVGLDILRAQMAPGQGLAGTITLGRGGLGYAPGLPGRRK